VGRHFGLRHNLHCRGRGLDLAARAPIRRARIERASNVDCAGLGIAQQLDNPGMVIDRLCLYHAGIIDYGLEQLPGCSRSHHNLATICLNQTTILHQGANSALVNNHVHQPVVGHIQRNGIATGQSNRPKLRDDHAGIGHIRAEQGYKAPLASGEHALVHNRLIARAYKGVFTSLEIGVGDSLRRCNQAAHIDLGAFAKQNTVRIDHEHTAIGRQPAQNSGCPTANDAVQCHRFCRRLLEGYGLIGADIEALPVNNRALASLADGDHALARRDARRACSDAATGRQGIGHRDQTKRDRSAQTHDSRTTGIGQRRRAEQHRHQAGP
jgi:hypothetical protein